MGNIINKKPSIASKLKKLISGEFSILICMEDSVVVILLLRNLES